MDFGIGDRAKITRAGQINAPAREHDQRRNRTGSARAAVDERSGLNVGRRDVAQTPSRYAAVHSDSCYRSSRCQRPAILLDRGDASASGDIHRYVRILLRHPVHV